MIITKSFQKLLVDNRISYNIEINRLITYELAKSKEKRTFSRVQNQEIYVSYETNKIKTVIYIWKKHKNSLKN